MPFVHVAAVLLALPSSFSERPGDRTTVLDIHTGSGVGHAFWIRPAEEKL